jgi:hypothetical protein
MPQFQILVILGFLVSILLNWLVFGSTTFNVGFTPFIVIGFLLAAIGVVYWTFFTPSGKTFTRKYNQYSAEKAYLTPEQRKIARSQAYTFGISGAVIGLIISLPSVWAALQMFNLAGGGSFALGYVIGITVVVFIGYLSGFGQGMRQFQVSCNNCSHKFILQDSGGNCPACGTGLYIDENGECKKKTG